LLLAVDLLESCLSPSGPRVFKKLGVPLNAFPKNY
jgi:hypothetical protein